MSQPDAYDQYIADWKRKQGVPAHAAEAPDDEALMAAEDAKDPGKAYCMGCADQYPIKEMRVVTDPYCQDDERPERADNYIPKKYRVRMCTKCFTENYPEEETE